MMVQPIFHPNIYMGRCAMKRVLCILGLLSCLSPISLAEPIASDGWTLYSAREEIRPQGSIESGANRALSLRLAGNGHESVDGQWRKMIPMQRGSYVVFSARYEAKGVPTPLRNIVASVVWFDANQRQVEQAEFPATIDEGGGNARMS